MATVELQRKKSPRAPSLSLDEALERTMKVYDQERLHAAPTDVVAQHMGYKGANNGAALSALASIRYYGLVDRPGDGLLAVSKDVEAYRFAPNEALRRSFLKRFLTAPPIFAELLDKYASGLPSDGNLKYELIQRGFTPASAAILVTLLKRSVEFAGVFSEASNSSELSTEALNVLPQEVASPVITRQAIPSSTPEIRVAANTAEEESYDRIPVRLPGARRAWLLIPHIFYEADKQRLKAQIDLLLTEEDGGS